MRITIEKTLTFESSSSLNVVIIDDTELKALSKVTRERPKSKRNSPFSGLSALSLKLLTEEIKRQDFHAKPSESLYLLLPEGEQSVALLLLGAAKKGLGSDNEESFKRYHATRKIGQLIFQSAKEHRFEKVTVRGKILDSKDLLVALLEGVALSGYSFTRYREVKKTDFRGISEIKLISSNKIDPTAVRRAEVYSEATIRARDLVNTPPRDCTPQALVTEARTIAKKTGYSCKIYTKADLRKLKAGIMLSVFESSNEEPFLIRLHYKPKKSKKKIALVGKGVTFDSGGLCIKTGPGMYDMKCDMSGAAAVLCTVSALGALKVPVEVVAYVPVTENMIRNTSTHPGDIVRGINGKTVEVLNTDAEGRLILADSLVLAEREKCDAIIDLATLTGSIVSAIGGEYAGLFSSDEKLAQKLLDASTLSSERLWRMPLAPEYRERLKSSMADLKNIGGAEAGSITAALFLKEFVDKTPWAHLDIAGPAHIESDRGYVKKGGTGFGVRTLLNYLESVG